MINLANFFTIQSPGNPQIGTGQMTQIPGSAATPTEGGFSVFDLLIAQLEGKLANGEEGEPLPEGAEEHSLLQSKNPALDQKPALELIKILAGNEDIADKVSQLDEIVGLDLIEEIEQTLALNQQVFDNIIEAGTGNDDFLQIDKETGEIVIPTIAEALNINEIAQQITSKSLDADNLAKISALIDDVDLSTLNLTPEEVTLVQEIQNGVVPTEDQAKKVQEVIEKIVSGFVAIVPPPVAQAIEAKTQNDIIIPPQAVKNAGAETPVGLEKTPAEGKDSELGFVKNAPEKQGAALPFGQDGEALDGEADFDSAIRAANAKKYGGNPIASGDVTPKAQPNTNALNNAAPQAAFNIMEAWPLSASGSLYGSASYSDQVAEQMGLTLHGQQNIAHGSLTSLVNQAQAASQPHPATQMVAASMTKSGINGKDTDISLRLDPPDLGRVDVKMTFGKDKTVKAVVTAEKPETFMMLQRDAQVLERALQEAGLDTDAGLSFELAEHGFDFDQHNQRGGGHDNGGTGGGRGSEGDLEIIETTMTWNVDPETGHTRYDIWA